MYIYIHIYIYIYMYIHTYNTDALAQLVAGFAAAG